MVYLSYQTNLNPMNNETHDEDIKRQSKEIKKAFNKVARKISDGDIAEDIFGRFEDYKISIEYFEKGKITAVTIDKFCSTKTASFFTKNLLKGQEIYEAYECFKAREKENDKTHETHEPDEEIDIVSLPTFFLHMCGWWLSLLILYAAPNTNPEIGHIVLQICWVCISFFALVSATYYLIKKLKHRNL